MPYVKVDDRLPLHPKMLAALAVEPLAFGAYVAGLCHANLHRTDGFLPRLALNSFIHSKQRNVVKALTTAGLWHEVEGGYEVHDYLDYQTSRDEMDSTRSWDVKRKSLHRDRELIAAIRDRDGDMCRYCGVVVDWTNRRGEAGGTYDHLIPRGPNTLDNLVVSCKRCNNIKGARTPEEAGLDLIPIRSGSVHDLNGAKNAS